MLLVIHLLSISYAYACTRTSISLIDTLWLFKEFDYIFFHGYSSN